MAKRHYLAEYLKQVVLFLLAELVIDLVSLLGYGLSLLGFSEFTLLGEYSTVFAMVRLVCRG